MNDIEEKKAGLPWSGWAVIVAVTLGLGSCCMLFFQSHDTYAEATYARKDTTTLQFDQLKAGQAEIKAAIKDMEKRLP